MEEKGAGRCTPGNVVAKCRTDQLVHSLPLNVL